MSLGTAGAGFTDAMTVITRHASFSPGNWLVTCDACGRELLASNAYHRWDGLIVCESDYEPRQPQDFVRSVPDSQSVPFVSPEPPDAFLEANDVTGDDL